MEIWRQESPIGCCVARSAHGILKAETCLNGDSCRNHEFHGRYPISEEPHDTNSPRFAANQTRDQNLNEFLRPLPAPFLNKTYQLVDDPATDDIISWSEDGTTFVVWRPVDFAKHVLPYHFKHNNLSSFVRQLNTYGFRKVVPDRWEFGNDFFRKGSKHLLNDIHRRKTPMSPCIVGTSPKQVLPLNDSVCEHATSSSSPLEPTEAKLSSAQTDEAERLKKENMLLFSELSCLRKLCSDLMLYIKTQVKGPLEYPSSIARFLQNGDVSEDASTDGSFTDRDKRAASDNNLYHTLQAHADDEICSSSLVSQRENLELRFVMPQNSETGAVRQLNERSPPRLFGVPLPYRKKDTVNLFKAV